MRQKKTLIAIPVYNEEKYVDPVLTKIRDCASPYTNDLLVIDDGSTDMTPMKLAGHPVEVIRHGVNRGYGQSMIDSFRWATFNQYDWLITMDCDEQHEPESLPAFFAEIEKDQADIISGSRYLRPQTDEHIFRLPDDLPPTDRRSINLRTTRMVNENLNYALTDSFCGFKAYRVASLRALNLDVTGYAFPLQFWVQAAAHGLAVSELPIRLIYNDPNRSFGVRLDDADERWRHYLSIYERELKVTGWDPIRRFEETSSNMPIAL